LKTKDLPKKFQIDDCFNDINIIKIN